MAKEPQIMMTTNAAKASALALKNSPRVLFVTPEFAPWMKTDGLGEVSADLCQARYDDGLDIMPGWTYLKTQMLGQSLRQRHAPRLQLDPPGTSLSSNVYRVGW
jgi:hypothetical protein